MTHLSLFSGIGGLDLAAEAAGFETVGQCEWAEYPTKILERHWPHVARWKYIRTLTGEDFYNKTGRRTVDVISGGFPCQPFSVAGKQKGKDDDRYLWPEMLRVIRELAPGWVVGENVPGILRIAAGQVAEDLERAGYHVAVFDFEAAAVGAWHRRERIAFVAHAKHAERRTRQPDLYVGNRTIAEREEKTSGVGTSGEDVRKGPLAYAQGDGIAQHMAKQSWEKDADAERNGKIFDTESQGLQSGQQETMGEQRKKQKLERSDSGAIKPGMGGMADGLPDWLDGEPDGIPRTVRNLPNRVSRIKALGNAVVPRQFYPIFKAIALVENGYEIDLNA